MSALPRSTRARWLTVGVVVLVGVAVLVWSVGPGGVGSDDASTVVVQPPATGSSADTSATTSSSTTPVVAPEPAPTTTSIPTPPQRFAVAGDVGTGDDVERRTAAAMDRVEGDDEYDALLLLGDNVYPAGDPTAVDRTVFEPFADVLDHSTRLVPVLGNHDVMDGHGDAQAAALGMPARWYARQVGDVRLIALDSTQPDNAEQLAWLESVLAGDTSPWTIVLIHHPPYSAGSHGSDTTVRELFTPLFARHGVDLVLSGHEHDYQRVEPVDGVAYVVTGAAAKLRPTGRAEFTEFATSTYSFVDLTVFHDRIELRAIDQSGRVLDRATVTPNDAG